MQGEDSFLQQHQGTNRAGQWPRKNCSPRPWKSSDLLTSLSGDLSYRTGGMHVCYIVPQQRYDFQPTACSGDLPDRLQQLTEKTMKMKTKCKKRKQGDRGRGLPLYPLDFRKTRQWPSIVIITIHGIYITQVYATTTQRPLVQNWSENF